MLQYAVDTKLDLCLSSMYEAVTKPPLPLNPYPRLLHILRAHAARLDLFQVSLAYYQGEYHRSSSTLHALVHSAQGSSPRSVHC